MPGVNTDVDPGEIGVQSQAWDFVIFSLVSVQ
jgi:hypothetical protein